MPQPDIPRIERAVFGELEGEVHAAVRDWIEVVISRLETGTPDAEEVERLRGVVDARFRGLTGYVARQLLANQVT